MNTMKRSMANLLVNLGVRLRQAWRRIAHPYRPERHYMRGARMQ